MRKKIIFLAIIFALILFFSIKKGGIEMKYDNDKNYNELVTCSYSTDELLKIQNEIINGESISLTEIVKKENIECVRNIGNTRYLLLTSENGEKLFIFFDEKKVVIDSYFVKEFLEQSAFDNVHVGNTRMSEITGMDNNNFLSPISSIEVTVHIVKEGVIVVEYDRVQGTTLLQDPVVKKIDFYGNDEILEQKDQSMLFNIAPYILPIDKY